jgi:hypothetical protein
MHKLSGFFFSAIIMILLLSSCGEKKFFGDVLPKSTPPIVEEKETIFELFKDKDQNTAIAVNKYIWVATLEVLNFLPIISADPFTGIISFGLGKVPGSNSRYKGTVLINDPALDARSLKVSLISENGNLLDPKTVREVENSILNRARQIYKEQGKL